MAHSVCFSETTCEGVKLENDLNSRPKSDTASHNHQINGADITTRPPTNHVLPYELSLKSSPSPFSNKSRANFHLTISLRFLNCMRRYSNGKWKHMMAYEEGASWAYDFPCPQAFSTWTPICVAAAACIYP